MFQLDQDDDRKRLAENIRADINEFSIQLYQDTEHRKRLGASTLGRECNRQLWYMFRWIVLPERQGREERLLNRGHLIEGRAATWIRGIGATLYTHDDNGQQYRMIGVDGHYGGSLDGVVILPERYGYTEPMLWENKGIHTKAFVHLLNNGVQKSKPEHYTQICNYGSAYGFKFALYTVTNKNDDDLYVEIVPIDPNVGSESVKRAEYIIGSKQLPRRVSEDPSFYLCKICDFHAQCHAKADYEVNCRSCHFAQPMPEGEWKCGKFGQILPEAFIPKGCQHHQPVGRV